MEDSGQEVIKIVSFVDSGGKSLNVSIPLKTVRDIQASLSLNGHNGFEHQKLRSKMQYSRLSLSRNPKDCIKYFEISDLQN